MPNKDKTRIVTLMFFAFKANIQNPVKGELNLDRFNGKGFDTGFPPSRF